ncbi:ATP-dependent protease subunit HslV [bacterium]|nr:ATP-dependent protease subunit HslV [bacterium]MBU2599196.1 ATP-dependent protease subunit HslV [bacterium]
MDKFKSTTIIIVRKDGKVAIGGDGQVSFGNTIMKKNTKKIRKIYENQILAGFAGAAADAFTLFDKLDGKLKEYKGNLIRAAVEMAKEWRTDKFLRRLEALLAVADKEKSLIISGNGEIIEPDDGLVAIGSGGPYALAAARALIAYSNLKAEEIVKESLKLASEICVFTNDQISIEIL